MAAVNTRGAISPVEACAIHRDRVIRRKADIDPNVSVRIERGCTVTAADYIYMLRERKTLVKENESATARSGCAGDADNCHSRAYNRRGHRPDEFGRCNGILLRNAAIGNFFDLCAISLPLQAALPVGFMLLARNGQDRRLLRIAAAVEKLLRT